MASGQERVRGDRSEKDTKPIDEAKAKKTGGATVEAARKKADEANAFLDEIDAILDGNDEVVERADDALLDEIDATLETNAAEFINSFKQVGGE